MTRRQLSLIHILSGILVVPLIWAMTYVVWPTVPPITWYGGRIIPPIVSAGQDVLIAREFTVTRDVQINIDRQFVKRDGAITTVVEMPGAQRQYKAGAYQQMRPFKLPCTLTEGEWMLENTLTYTDDIGRKRVLYPPTIPIKVVRGCE